MTDRATSLLIGTANVPKANAEQIAAIQPHISQEDPMVEVSAVVAEVTTATTDVVVVIIISG